MGGEATKRLDQPHFGNDIPVEQIGRSHDLDKISRASLGGKQRGQQQERVNIVDRVHGINL